MLRLLSTVIYRGTRDWRLTGACWRGQLELWLRRRQSRRAPYAWGTRSSPWNAPKLY